VVARVAFRSLAPMLGLGLMLAACSSLSQADADRANASNYVADHVPTWMGGETPKVPRRTGNEPAFPAIYSSPDGRPVRALSAEEQKKLERDLVAARNRAAAKSRAPTTANDETTGSNPPTKKAAEPDKAPPNSN
jgi:hypothetical protein